MENNQQKRFDLDYKLATMKNIMKYKDINETNAYQLL